jgi:hypothetical protein
MSMALRRVPESLDKAGVMKILKEQEDNGDWEVAHIMADEAISAFLRHLGHEDVADAWEVIGKWYA